MGASFNYDLKQSHQRETNFANALQQHGFTNITLDQTVLKSDWDVSASLPGYDTAFTFEVKYDRYAGVKSNNVAVEVMKKKDGRWVTSGIHSTESTFFAYTFQNDTSFYVVDRKALVDMHMSCGFNAIKDGGDRNEYRIMLIDLDRFKAMAKKLTPHEK